MALRALPQALGVITLVVGGLSAGLLALLVALTWWDNVSNEGLVTVVNRSGSTVVEGVLHAGADYRFDGLKSGERRRVVFHPNNGDSYRVEGRLSSGRPFESLGPYSSQGYGSRSPNGPDQETVLIIGAGSVGASGPDEASSAQQLAIIGLGGYQPDRRLTNPSGDAEAVIRVGPSLRADAALRVTLVAPGAGANSGPLVLEATQIEGLHLTWLSARRLKIDAQAGHVLWARSAIGALSRRIVVDVDIAHRF